MVRLRRRLRRDRARFLLFAGLLTVLAGVATTAHASPDPSVSFAGSGSSTLSCTSTPEVSSLTIQQGGKVNLINRTGARARVFIGGVAGVTLEIDNAVRIRLKAGQHNVQLRPDCAFVGAIGTLVVTVVTGEQGRTQDTPDPLAPGAPSTEAQKPGSTSPAAVAGGDQSRTTSGAGSAPGAGPGPATAAAAAPPVSSDAPFGAVSEGAEAGGFDVGAFEAPYVADGHSSDPREGRLLMVIALICVFGVSAGIIRAIVAQRTDSAIGA